MRTIPDDNLAYPVLLKLNTWTAASGFFLRDGVRIFLVTAKHVLFEDDWRIKWVNLEITYQAKDLSCADKWKYNLDLSKLTPMFHPHADVAIIEVGSIEKSPAEGAAIEGIATLNFLPWIAVLQKVPWGITCVLARKGTKSLSEVMVSNDVYLYGYPLSLWLTNMPQFNYDKPLIRKGIIANVHEDKWTIILDCPVYPGNSWGLVVEVEQVGIWEHNHKIIWVVSQFIPFVSNVLNSQSSVVANSGYSVAVSMDKVFELIDNKL